MPIADCRCVRRVIGARDGKIVNCLIAPKSFSIVTRFSVGVWSRQHIVE